MKFRKLLLPDLKGAPILGTILLEADQEERLHALGRLEFAILDDKVRYPPPGHESVNIQRGVIMPAFHYSHPDAVFLLGISVIQLERLPGFHFFPSAEYVRLAIEGAFKVHA